MTLRRLPETIRDMAANLRRSLGTAGLIVGLIALPVVLLVALISFPFVAIVRRLKRSSSPGAHKTLEVGPGDLTFGWTGDGAHCRQALSEALQVLVERLPGAISVPAVETLEIRNPETGFAVDPDRLRAISSDHASDLAEMLWGEKLEYGELVINGETVLGGLDVEARSPRTGHLGLDLPRTAGREALVARAQELGFEVPA